jgi:glycosyltransferase involved in cell wall biosynthesis
VIETEIPERLKSHCQLESVRLPSSPRGRRDLALVRAALRRSTREADLLLTREGLALRLAVLRMLGLPLPPIATIAYDPLPQRAGLGGLLARAEARIRMLLYRRIDRFIMTTEAMAVWFGGRLDDDHKVGWISASVDLDTFRRTRPPQGAYLFMVDGAERDYAVIAGALRRLEPRSRSLVIAHRRKLPADVRGHLASIEEAGHDVSTVSNVSGAELRRLYEDCAAVVVPILPSNQPAGLTALLEALAMGCALVATRDWATEEYVSDADSALLVPSRDVDAMTSALARVLDDPATADRLLGDLREAAA